MRQQLPWLGAVMIASTLGSIAILRLWLARSGTSVGEALRFAFVMIPTMIILFLVQSLLRSEEHTSELQSLMRISYAVFCLKKKKQNNHTPQNTMRQTH